MTPSDLLALRHRLGLTQAALAPLLGAGGARTIRMWESGRRKIPRSVEMLAENLAVEMDAHAALIEFLAETAGIASSSIEASPRAPRPA